MMFERIIKALVYSALFFVGIILTVIGNTAEGWSGVWIMMSGLGCLVLLLYMYNGKYR